MRASAVVALTFLLAAASCASVGPGPSPAASVAGAGTVLTVRPVVPTARDGDAWRVALLNGAVAPAGTMPSAGASLAEFIVREDAGATVSIVQSNAAGLRAGDRVMVTRPPASPGRATLGRLL